MLCTRKGMTTVAYIFITFAFITLLFNFIPNHQHLHTTNKELRHIPRYNHSGYHVCNTFHFARTEWTLYWLSTFDPSIEEESCRILHRSIFKEKSVKWIVYPNRSITNLGCTKYTRACRPAAHFDKQHNVRINTPPCCKKKLLEILKILTQGLQKLRIPHVLCGGAVIGWIRYGGIIPYDEDLDVLVDAKYWKSEAFLSFLEHSKVRYGLKFMWRKDQQSFSVDYSKINDNGIGFWAMRTIPRRKVRIPNYKNRDQPYRNIYPPRKVNFSGITTFVPNKPKRFCDVRYGKGKWEKELQCKKLSHRKCIK